MKKQRSVSLTSGVILLSFITAATSLAGTPAGSDLARHLIQKAGVSHGLCSVLGSRDGALALELVRGSEFFVHVQDPEEATVVAARKTLDVNGLYGTRVLVEQRPLNRLVFADNTVDVVLVLLGGGRAEETGAIRNELNSLSLEETLRVLRPGGKAIIGTAKDSEQQLAGKGLARRMREKVAGRAGIEFVKDTFGSWAELTKTEPEGMDCWSHWEHGPDNNPVSTDKVIKAPYRTQWIAGPLYSAMPAITTVARGRIFTALGHIAHHRREEPWLNTLLARSGYNGTLLWSRKLPDGYLVHRSAFIATDEHFYMIDNDGCLRLDPATGREIDRISIPEIEGEWKYIAMQDGVMYVLIGKARDSSETTVVRSTHSHWSWGELSPGYYAKRVPWGFGTKITAYDVASREVLWQHSEKQDIDSRAMVIGGGRVFFYCPNAHTGCLDALSGQVAWRNDDSEVVRLIEQPGRGLQSTPGFRTSCYSLYTPDVILYQAQTRMNVVAVSSKDGRLLWTRKKTTNNPNMLYVGGKVVVGIGPDGSTLVLEPRTGETIRDLGFRKRSCARLTATPDSFFCRGWREGLTRYDREAQKVLFNGALRPACNDGVIAANGMLYMGPWLCDCNLSLMGTFGLCSAGGFRVEDVDPVSSRLIVCQANDSIAEFPQIAAEDWPTYRAGNIRNACSPVDVSANPKPRWTYYPQKSFVPSAPTAAGQLVFVCGNDGKVRALDGQTGELKWSFAAAGPVSQPPALWNARAYVGSSDGSVYCLEAATGRLLWRYRVAPVERRMMVYDRLCSTWPVASGVLVQDGIAYAAAGIIDYDGTYVCALDARTGRPRWENNTSGHLDKQLRKGVSAQGVLALAADRLWMPGGNVISPACYSLDDGRCMSLDVGNGSPKANRGEEIGVLRGDHLVFGGRLRYSGVRNYVNPGLFSVAEIGRGGIGRSVQVGSGKIPPAWSSKIFVMADGPRSIPVCANIDDLLAYQGRSAPSDRPAQSRHSAPLKRRWTAQELQSSDPIAFVIAGNAVLAVLETPRPRVLASNWQLAAIDPDTGKILWKRQLRSAALPGGLLVNRHGMIIVVHEDGSVTCFG